MARGSASKDKITKKILEIFEGSFVYNGGKEIRIPMMEDGELVQIKITQTAAKTNVEPEDDNVMPGTEKKESENITVPIRGQRASSSIIDSGPTEEEKQNVKTLLEKLGL